MAEQHGQSVGEVLLERTDNLLKILAGEPKHSLLDAAFLALLEAYDRMVGTPARPTGHFTTKGEPLVTPPQGPADPHESWEREKPTPVPASELEGGVGEAVTENETT